MHGRCEVESTFCVPDRPTQKMRFLCSRLGSTQPTDPPRAARRKFLDRNDPTDRPSSAGSRPRSRVGMLFFMLFEGYLVKMWYIACIPDSGRPDRPTRPDPTRPSRTDPTDRPSLRPAADAELTFNFAPPMRLGVRKRKSPINQPPP